MKKNNLKSIRKAKNLTLKDLGEMCGKNPSSLLYIENGSETRLSTAYIISKALNVSVYEIWPDTTEIIEEVVTVRRTVKRVVFSG